MPQDSPFSRRRFLLIAGQVGCALPLFGRTLFARLAIDAAPASAGDMPFALLSGLRWRLLGPFRGGRVDAVSGVPGRPNEFYFGSVNGGVWKSIDAGRVWQPVFDSQSVASIGALAVAPSAPDTIYVGTGESTLRDSTGYGSGVFKSTDAGHTWTRVGLDDTQHIGRIAVDPHNPDIAFVAALGQLYASNEERGVFRTKDGGRSWQKVLYKSADVGAVEVVIDPSNSRVVYAGLWNTRRPPWFTYAPTNGPGGGIYKSVDGGDTWQQLTAGLPPAGIGRTGLAVCPSNPQRVYAVVDCLLPEPGATVPPPTPPDTRPTTQTTPLQGGFFRSDDAGATWTRLSSDPALWGRGWYFEKVTVDPKNADVVYVPNVAVNRSMDGGRTWVALRGSPGGDDYHQAWVSPEDTNTLVQASDQGCIITRNAQAPDPRDVTWSSWLNQPTAQIYHVSVDPRFPYWVTGAQQDSGSVAVRSRGKFAQISMRDWEPIGAGGESGYTAGDPLHPGMLYGGAGSRYDLELNRPIPGTTQPKAPATARTDWTQPLVLSKADSRTLYYANQFLFKSTDTAQTWAQISPDLTRPDPGVPSNLDATAAHHTDRNGRRGVIYTIAPSPITSGLVWIGTDDGLVHLTPDDGKTWQDVTPAALSSWSRVTMMEASHFEAKTAYASVDRHQLQDFEPYIYRTRDSGKTWDRITKGLPAGVYVHTVKEDTVRKGLLFAGTERGAFVSFDDGDGWQPLQFNLPVTSVRDFEVYDKDLIVATHGRGFWVIDGIGALREMNATIAQSDAYLFKPADALNYIKGGDNGTPFQKDEAWAENPPDGAYIDYYLRNDASGPVTLEILDASGTVLRTFSNAETAPGAPTPDQRTGIPRTSPLWRPPPAPFAVTAGMHRTVWLPVAATPPDAQPSAGGLGQPPVLLTGTFKARLTVNRKSYTQTFDVKPDPRN